MLCSMALESIAPGVWVAHYPHVYMGLHIGTRMSIVRLTDGSLVVYSPIPIDATLKEEIDALGPVAHIVAPSRFHHVYFGDFAAAYPHAKKHGCKGLEAKRPDLSFDAWLGDAPDPTWGSELEPVTIAGQVLEETEIFHHPSRTLITVDLIQNFDSSEHWATRQYLKVAGIHRKVGVSRPVRLMYRDRSLSRRTIDELVARRPEAITLAHGRPILERATEELRNAYAWL